jgi:hypothetical protein
LAGVVLSPGPEHPPEESGETVNARADVRPVPDGPARWPVLVAVAVVVASVAGFCAGLWMELQSGRREEFGDQVAFLAFAAVGAAIFARRPGLVARFVRSDGVERLQLKWFTYAARILFVYIMFGGVLLEDMLGIRSETEIPLAMAFAFLPISSGIAILRYRLYEIDRIISRTVSYGAVAGLLALVYVGGIVLIQSIVPASGSLAVAASTLAAAALFNPVRRRTLGLIDRRFNRSRYNAELEVQAFAGRLKSQMELEAVSADVTRVLARTLQPGSAGVWIRSHHSPV